MTRAARSWTLPAAAWLGAVEVAVLIAMILGRDMRGKGMYIAFLVVKLPFCALVVQRRAGAYLALMVWELGGVVTALAARDAALGGRLLEVGLAAAVMSLLVASMPLFPSVRLADIPDTGA